MRVQRNNIRVIKEILNISNTKIITFTMIVILGLVSSWLSVLSTQFISVIISRMSSNENTPSTFFEKLIINLGSYLNIVSAEGYIVLFGIFIVVSVIIRNVFCYIASINSNRMIFNVRNKLFHKIISADVQYIEKKSKSDIMYNVINNTDEIDSVFSTPLYTILSDFFDFLWISLFFFTLGLKYFLLAISVIPVVYFASVYVGKKQRKLHAAAKDLSKDKMDILDQLHDGFESVVLYSGTENEKSYFNNKSNQWRKARNKADFFLSIYFPFEKYITTIATVILLLICLNDIKKGQLNIGIFPVVIVYIGRYYHPITSISKYYQMIQRGLSSLTNILLFLDELDENIFSLKELPKHLNNNIAFSINNYSHRFKDISTGVIDNQNIPINSLTIVTGASGVGKTTLIKSLIGYNKLYNGVIKTGLDTGNWFNNFSYASQCPFIINGSVYNNITYPREIEINEKEKVEELAKVVGLSKKFLEREISDRGRSLSGGEKQRINLLRALYSNRKVIILDEVSANIDCTTEEKIFNYLVREKTHKTIILITHSRSETVFSNADQIISIEKGQLCLQSTLTADYIPASHFL